MKTINQYNHYIKDISNTPSLNIFPEKLTTEHFAKIIHEERAENKNLWKYTFLDIESSQIDHFYSGNRLNNVPHLPSKLDLSFDEETKHKFLQSFEQINITEEEFQQLQLNSLEREWKESIKKGKSEINKKKKKRLTFQEVNHLLQKGLSRKDIADYANVTIWNIDRIISKGKRGIIPSNDKGGRPRKIAGYDLNVLYSYFLSDRATTQQERADYLLQERDLEVHRSTISRTFKRDDFTNKRAAKQYLELNIKKVKQFIKDNYQLFTSPRCLAVDEFGVNLGETSRYAYARKGCRAIISRLGQKGCNHTVILCVRNVNEKPVVSYKIIKNEKKKKDKKDKNKEVKKETKAVDFYEFIKNLDLPTNELYFLLLDNSPIHYTTKELEELSLSMEELTQQKNIVLKYFPTYAPMLNPVELCIGFIKSHLEEELRKAIEETITLLNQQDLTKNFLHCRDYFKID